MAHGCDHYRLLGRSGLRVSPLCLGTMTFGEEWGYGASAEESRAIFELYREAGGNFIDTANFYTNGTSELLLGQFLEGRRDEFVLATKFTLNMRDKDPNTGGNHRKCIVQSLEASLKRLQTDYIDLYWLHMWEDRTPIEETLRALDDLVSSGKILYIGVSDTPAWIVSQANTIAHFRGWAPFTALQIRYNLIDRTAERDLIPMARELGLGVTPWSPLAAGLLSGKYGKPTPPDAKRSLSAEKLTERNLQIARTVEQVAQELGCTASQVALRWLVDQPGVVSPIVGARTLKQFEENLAALAVTLEPAHFERLHEASRSEPGFPHDFLSSKPIRDRILGGTIIEER